MISTDSVVSIPFTTVVTSSVPTTSSSSSKRIDVTNENVPEITLVKSAVTESESEYSMGS